MTPGLSGLVAAKECLEEGFVPTIYESRDGIGGQWKHEEPNPVTGEAHSSIYDGTIANSCRDTSSFSDFPIDPARYPDYSRHEQFLQYIREYADHFALEKFIVFQTKVLNCEQLPDGRWTVTSVRGEEIYDGLLVCTGKNNFPSMPQFDGLENFRGDVVHSHVYRRPASYAGKRVAIVGFGSSAVDLSSEICTQAQSCHLVTRRGGWVLPRHIMGSVSESYESRLSQYLVPEFLMTVILEFIYRLVMGKIPPELKPDHRILEQNPSVRDEFLDHVRAGRITAHRTTIDRFTETGMCLNNGKVLEVDAVIFCTGYRNLFPFIADSIYVGKRPNSLHLYRMIVPPQLQNIFFLGLVELAAPIHIAVELQARWVVGVLSGRITLPSNTQMCHAIEAFEKRQSHLVSKAFLLRWIGSDYHSSSTPTVMLPPSLRLNTMTP